MAINYPISIAAGEDWSLSMTLLNNDDTAATVTNGICEIRKAPSEDIILTTTVSTPGSGVATISLTSAQTILYPNTDAYYDVFLTVNGALSRICYGKFTIESPISDVDNIPS